MSGVLGLYADLRSGYAVVDRRFPCGPSPPGAMGLVSDVGKKHYPLLDCDDGISSLTDNLYLLLHRNKAAKPLLKLGTTGLSSDAKAVTTGDPQPTFPEQ